MGFNSAFKGLNPPIFFFSCRNESAVRRSLVKKNTAGRWHRRKYWRKEKSDSLYNAEFPQVYEKRFLNCFPSLGRTDRHSFSNKRCWKGLEVTRHRSELLQDKTLRVINVWENEFRFQLQCLVPTSTTCQFQWSQISICLSPVRH
jgi:hypothetical protein